MPRLTLALGSQQAEKTSKSFEITFRTFHSATKKTSLDDKLLPLTRLSCHYGLILPHLERCSLITVYDLIHESKDVYSGLQYNGKVAVDFSSTASFVLAFIKLLSCKGPRDYNLFNLYFLRLGLQVNGIINQHDSFFLLLAGCIDLYSSVSQMLAFVIEKEQQ